MGRAEAPIQAYVMDRLARMEVMGQAYYFRNNSFSGRITRYDGSQGYVKNNKLGMPDVVACLGGRFVGIECKAPKGTLSPFQKRAKEDIERSGGLYWVVRTPEQFEELVRQIDEQADA